MWKYSKLPKHGHCKFPNTGRIVFRDAREPGNGQETRCVATAVHGWSLVTFLAPYRSLLRKPDLVVWP